MAASLPDRLRIGAGSTIRLLEAPAGYEERLVPLPDGAAIARRGRGPFDVVQLFVADHAALVRRVDDAIAMSAPGGILWVTYPKKGSGVASDLGRDEVWRAVRPTGWRPVAQIAVDDVWSALRFKPEGEVGG